MFSLAFSILKNKEDTEEAVSNAFIKIMENIDKISKIKCHEIAPYCVTILKNETINIIRKNKKYVTGEDLYMDNKKFLESSLEEELIKKYTIEDLKSHLNLLNEEEKNLLNYRYDKKLSFKEIGKSLNIPEATARKKHQRILQKLREKLEGGEDIG